MSGGGKGGESVATVDIDDRLEEAAVAAVEGSLRSAGLEYQPNRGVTIAAFSPQQEAAFAGADAAAAAYGLPTSGGESYLPEAQTTKSGYKGYSTGELYDEGKIASTNKNQRRERREIHQGYTDTADKIAAMPAPKDGGGGGGK